GKTWTNTTIGQPPLIIPLCCDSGQEAFTDLVMNPQSPNILLAAVGTPQTNLTVVANRLNGVYLTVDGGATWVPSPGFPIGASSGNIKRALSPPAPGFPFGIAYAARTNPATQLLADVQRSLSGGVLTTPGWTTTPAKPPEYQGGQGFYDSSIAVDPTNPLVV